MRVLLWHGYLLRGSGSNILTANLARTLRATGHDVTVVCQERQVADLGFVDEWAPVGEGGIGPRAGGATTPASGTCRVLNPAIGTVLPVYVWDHYEGFVAKRFVDTSEGELDGYVEANVEALNCIQSEFDPEVVLVGHEVMGPYIARVCNPRSGYSVQLHGSALEYAVKVQDRFRRYASDGLSGARRVIGGSRYMVDAASSVVPGWEERAAVVNPGCDVQTFRPAEKPTDHPVVGFVGKLIAAKGVHLLLAALGSTTTPGLRCVVVGYGGMEERLKELAAALAAGDEGWVRRVASDGGEGPLPGLLSWLDRGGFDARARARFAEVPVVFAGRLEHGPLSELLPTFKCLAVPSVLPEAFGMVAAEAAAAGVLPIVPGHSGIGEAGAALEAALGSPGLLTFDPADPVSGLSSKLDEVLSLPPAVAYDLGRRARQHAETNWDWPVVAQRLLEVAR